jgi:hypothetical protein
MTREELEAAELELAAEREVAFANLHRVEGALVFVRVKLKELAAKEQPPTEQGGETPPTEDS